MSDFIIKPRRKKKVDVPVHRSPTEGSIKTYGAQFPGKKRCGREKSVDFVEYKTSSIKSASGDELDLVEENPRPHRKKYLKAENQRLKDDNKNLSEKVEQIEEYYKKKFAKFKEKFESVQSYNEEISNEYNTLKTQYQELLDCYQTSIAELEACRTCKTCEELKKVVHRNNEDYNRIKSVNKGLNEDITMLKTVVYR